MTCGPSSSSFAGIDCGPGSTVDDSPRLMLADEVGNVLSVSNIQGCFK